MGNWAAEQDYTINNLDLGLCIEVLLLAWKYPDIYYRDIISSGPFHTKMNYIGMLTNHKAKASW